MFKKRILAYLVGIIMLLQVSFMIFISGDSSLAAARPYLQAVTPTSIYVMVESKSKSSVSVQYGTSTSYGKTASTKSTVKTKEGTYIHRVKITGLNPNTKYHYKASSRNSDYTFKTATLPGTGFRFAWMADTRSNQSIHAKIAKRVLSDGPAFSLYGGGLCVDSSYSAYKKEFFIDEEELLIARVPFFNTPGNHEDWGTNTKAFTYGITGSSGTQDYYSFDYGDMHVLVMNTEISYSRGSSQYNFAKKDLSSTNKKWKVVISHKPAYASGRQGQDQDANMKILSKEVFIQNKVNMVISGHSHYYQHNLVDGIHHMVIGSAGAGLYSPGKASYTIKSEKAYNYAMFDVSSSQFKMVAKNENGKTLETITLNINNKDINNKDSNNKDNKDNKDNNSSGNGNAKDGNVRESGSLKYNGKSVNYVLQGGVNKSKNNVGISTTVKNGQTQIISLGTSDGGDTSKDIDKAVDKSLMRNQGFTLIGAEGDKDARTEVWSRTFSSQNSTNSSKIAISGDSKDVAWAIATIDTKLSSSTLKNNKVSSGAWISAKKDNGDYGWLQLNSNYQREKYQFKFVAIFLDDTFEIYEEEENDHMISAWGQGDGDTFIFGIWGSGENVKDKIRVKRKEDWSCDWAAIASGHNP